MYCGNVLDDASSHKTEFIAAQVVEQGVPRIISTGDGRTTPSVVSIGANGEVLVGRAAKRWELGDGDDSGKRC